jgi:hypothetical protein
MVTGVAGDQADQAASRLVGLRVEGQHVIVVEVQEPDEASAALRLPDQRAELLVRGALRELGEQRLNVGLADTGVDAVQDNLKRPFAGQYMAAHDYVEHSFGCHRFLPFWGCSF